MNTPPGTLRSRSFTRLTIRVGLPHFGQLVLLDVSITFLRSPVFAILAIENRLLFGAGARLGGIALAGHGTPRNRSVGGLLPKNHPGSFRLHRNPRRLGWLRRCAKNTRASQKICRTAG